MNNLQKSILATIIYADMFDQPLNFKWLSKRLHSKYLIKPPKIKREVDLMLNKKIIDFIDGYYCLPKRLNIVKKYKQRKKYSQKKFNFLYNKIKLFTWIPWIEGIFITGSLATNNCKKNDDIDLMIICQKDTIWIVRLIIILISEFFSIRRRPNSNETNNLLCFNLFLDTTSLKMHRNIHNIYIASEIMQTIPIYIKNNIDYKFYYQNKWIEKYLNNWFIQKLNINNKLKYYKKYNLITSSINKILFNIQFFYMRKRKNQEIVTLNKAFFHPNNRQKSILNQFYSRKKLFRLV